MNDTTIGDFFGMIVVPLDIVQGKCAKEVTADK